MATPVLADTTSGTVLAYDRVAKILIMEDKTIWRLSDTTVIPENLVAGDTIKITFTSGGDEGVRSVNVLERI